MSGATPVLTRFSSGSTTAGSRIAAAAQDIAQGLLKYRLWTALAWEDIKGAYHRTLLGVLWITASFAVFVVVKLVIFIPMTGSTDASYFSAYLILGFFVFQFISMTIGAGPTVFLGAESWIKNDPLPLSLYVFQSIARSLYNMGLTAVVVIGVMIYLGRPVGPVALMAVPAALVILLNAVWVELLLATVCTRHRDAAQIVQTIMRAVFFLTPIFWLPQQMGAMMTYLWWNPFFHYIAIFRAPLIDGDPAAASWAYVGVVTVIGWILAFATFAAFRRRIVFWF